MAPVSVTDPPIYQLAPGIFTLMGSKGRGLIGLGSPMEAASNSPTPS